MIIVRITGGLGNQMFQYAFARSLQAQGKKVFLEWHGHRTKSRHNGFELNTVFSQVLSDEIPLMNRNVFLNAFAWIARKTARQRQSSNVGYNPEFMEATGGYLDGYWQTEKYFSVIADQIRNDFRFKPLHGEKNLKLLQQLAGKPCTSIHVRRGDYVNHSGLGGICTRTYYERAVEKMLTEQPDSSFVIFSDDISYCRELFSGLETVFVDWNRGENSWMDMALMSQCRHHIIANSSFSWWGAWLGTGGITLAPCRWFSETSTASNPDIYPEAWITVP